MNQLSGRAQSLHRAGQCRAACAEIAANIGARCKFVLSGHAGMIKFAHRCDVHQASLVSKKTIGKIDHIGRLFSLSKLLSNGKNALAVALAMDTTMFDELVRIEGVPPPDGDQAAKQHIVDALLCVSEQVFNARGEDVRRRGRMHCSRFKSVVKNFANCSMGRGHHLRARTSASSRAEGRDAKIGWRP